MNKQDAILETALAKEECQRYAITYHHPAYKYFMDLHDRLDVDSALEVSELVPGRAILQGFGDYVI